jgi:uncharacterized protein
MPQTARQQDQNGFLHVRKCPISSFGIFQYSAAQVGLDGDPNRIVNVFRPESAVSDHDLIASLQEVPLIDDHEMLSGFAGDETATAPEDYGIDGILYDVAYSTPWVNGDLKVFTRKMQALLNSGKKDLSLGYTCDFLLESGTFDGQDYEVIQVNMRGNHIALVDVGRVPGARVLDGGKKLCFDSLNYAAVVSSQPGEIMKRKALDSNVVATLQAQLKALLPTFEQFLSEEATEPAHQGAAGEMGGAAEGAAGGAAENPAAAAGGEAAGAAEADPTAGATGTGEVAAETAAGEGQEATPTEGEEDAGAAGAAEAQPGAEGQAAEAGGEQEGGAREQLIASLKAMLAQLEGGAAGDEGEEGEATNAGSEEANDTVEGVEGTAREGADEGGATGEQGRASEGPAAGVHAGADAALRSFHADLAAKNRFVDRLSKVVGAFDGAMDLASATAADVAVYGVKKLKLKCVKGQEVTALDAYLNGVEAATKQASVNRQTQRAADAALQEVPAIDAYFKE